MENWLKFCCCWAASLHWVSAVTTVILQIWKYDFKTFTEVSRLLSLGHPLLLLLVLWSFLCFVIQQNFISSSILCYAFSPFPSLPCPYFLFCLPVDKVSEYDEFKGHHDTDGSQFHILALHHISPVGRELKCSSQNCPADGFSQALTALGFLCVASNFSAFGDGTPRRVEHKPKQTPADAWPLK